MTCNSSAGCRGALSKVISFLPQISTDEEEERVETTSKRFRQLLPEVTDDVDIM
jgi:hypothetical protein